MGSSKKYDSELSGVRAKFVEYKKTPPNVHRDLNKKDPDHPKNEQDFAKRYGVSRKKLWEWKQDPDFKREVADEQVGILTVEELAAIFAIQKTKALNGDRHAAKLVIDWSGILNSGKENYPNFPEENKKIKRMSEADLKRLAGEEEFDLEEYGDDDKPYSGKDTV